MIRLRDVRRGGGKDALVEGGRDAKPAPKAAVRTNKLKAKRAGREKGTPKDGGGKDGDADQDLAGEGDEGDDVMPEAAVENEAPIMSGDLTGGWDPPIEGAQGGDDDGGDDTPLAERDGREAQPDGDDVMIPAEAFRMDRFDAESDAGSRTGASDRDGEADKENWSGAANAQVCDDEVFSEPDEGGAWSGLCTRHGRRVAQKELLVKVETGEWGASDFAREDGQAVSKEMLGNTILHTRELLEEAGVDWRSFTDDVGDAIGPYSPLKLAIGRRRGVTNQGGARASRGGKTTRRRPGRAKRRWRG